MKLLDYIGGFRKGKEAHRLEKESMKDPFLADAMDGYHQVEGKHEERIKELQIQIKSRSAKKKNSYAINWSIAACLIMGFGIGSYFLFLKKKEIVEDVFTVKETTIPTTVIPDILKEEVIPSSPAVAKMKQDSNHVITINKVDRKEIIAKSEVSPKVQSSSIKVGTRTVEEAIKPIVIEEEKVIATDTPTLQTDENKIKLWATTKADKRLIGKVTNSKDQPLIGANITYGEKGYGTRTDSNGKFSIPQKQLFGKLEVNYIGYDPLRINVDTNQVIFIPINESSYSKLHEVVIAGIDVPNKTAVTGAVTSIKIDPSEVSSSALAGSIVNANLENLKKTSRQIIPEPVIGMKKYQKYLKKKLIRPSDETGNRIKGKVVLVFLVNQKGRPYGFIVEKGLCESADKEAIRLIQEGPDWTSGNESVEITVEF